MQICYARITRSAISAKKPTVRQRTLRKKQFIARIKRKVCFGKNLKSVNKSQKKKDVRRVIHEESGSILKHPQTDSSPSFRNESYSKSKVFFASDQKIISSMSPVIQSIILYN